MDELQESARPQVEIATAVVVDQLELFRIGVAEVLGRADVEVVASSAHASEAMRTLREKRVDLLVVGRHSDLKPQSSLREAKRLDKSVKVMLLLDRAETYDVARLVSIGADALLLRGASAAELEEAIERLRRDERLVVSALAAGTIGRVGPNVHVSAEEASERSGLSRKELEVLAELATGATYKEIADTLIVTQATVKTHLVHVYAKLQVRNRHEAVARGLALGLLS